MKTAIKREQCQSRLNTVEREQARPKVKLYHASTLIIEKPDVLTEVEQTISKTITFGAPVEMNKHYSLLMHLGLTGVKFTASVSNWETGYMFDTNSDGTPDSNEIALPINVSD